MIGIWLLNHEFVDYLETGYVNRPRAENKIIDAYFDQSKTILDVSKTVGKSSRDLIAVMKMHKQELQLLQKVMHGDTHVNNKKDVNQEKEDCQSRPVYTKAYKLFSQVMTPVHVAIELRFHYRHNKMVYGVFEDEAST